MSPGFLTPAAAPGAPPARSPLADAASGAICETRDGWETIVSFGDLRAEAEACATAVGFADLSPLTKLEVHRRAAARGVASAAERRGSVWICPVRPDLDLMIGPPGVGEEMRARLGDAPWTDVSGSLGAIAVAGPAARDLFARFCALDLRESQLPVAGFRPGSVARTPGYVLREAPQRFLMIFGAAYGIYVWEVVADAAARLGGRPVGVDALPDLEGTAGA